MADDKTVAFTFSEPHLQSFPNIAVPKRVSKSAAEKEKYSDNFEFEPDSDDLKRLRAAIVATAQAKWPGKNIGEAIKSGALKVPLTSGDVLADKAKEKSADTGKERLREWSRGKQVLVARSEFQPEISFIEGGKWNVLTDQSAIVQAEKNKFFTGSLCLGEVSLVAYDAVGESGKPGVTAYLNKVCAVVGKGEKLIKSGRTGAEAFSSYIGIESDEDLGGGAPATADTDW